MVRINLIKPENLSDQHLIAEYREILMLLGYVKKYQDKKTDIPLSYKLGKGHIIFFKDKLLYLSKRHEQIRKEMEKRGFEANIKADLHGYHQSLKNDWIPKENDIQIIKERLISKISKKSGFYRYYGIIKENSFFRKLILSYHYVLPLQAKVPVTIRDPFNALHP